MDDTSFLNELINVWLMSTLSSKLIKLLWTSLTGRMETILNQVNITPNSDHFTGKKNTYQIYQILMSIWLSFFPFVITFLAAFNSMKRRGDAVLVLEDIESKMVIASITMFFDRRFNRKFEKRMLCHTLLIDQQYYSDEIVNLWVQLLQPTFY